MSGAVSPPGILDPQGPGRQGAIVVSILETMDVRALAADEGWEFLFVLGQPRFEGAVQAVINPVAER